MSLVSIVHELYLLGLIEKRMPDFLGHGAQVIENGVDVF